MNNLPTKSCLACNKILYGRIDKKFCCESCRNNYNNQQNAESTNYMRNIIRVLRKNRRILLKLLGEEDMLRTTKDKLMIRGFQFKYHTHTFPTKKGGMYLFCFELGYQQLENDWVLIVRRNED